MGIDADARRTGHHDTTWSVDVETGQPMTTVQGRGADAGLAWLQSRPHAERARVAVVVVEMSKPFCAAITEVGGDTGHGIDRCHVVQQAGEARDEGWRAVHKQRAPEDATA